VIGHRIKLVEELCQRFGIEYISQIEQKNLEGFEHLKIGMGSKERHSVPEPLKGAHG
jgi:hypothetical protein